MATKSTQALSDSLGAYIPLDRRRALVQSRSLPERTEGTALFADISGFTPLTEALVQTYGPRRGAEELTQQLNRVYDELITQVHAYRGTVISFAGDAVTCWFDNKAHSKRRRDKPEIAPLRASALQAAACALACQQAMQPFKSVTLPGGGTISLAIKISVASGPARRFVVGDPDIQLVDVLAGETLMRLARGEKRAERGEVVVDAPSAALLGHEAHLVEIGEGESERFFRLLALDIDVTPMPWPESATDGLSKEMVRPWLLPPIYTRLYEGLGEFLTELRPSAALFLRFEGIDYDGDEAAGAKLDAYIRWVQKVLAHHEGYFLQLTIGDKGSFFYAAFGAPVAHEDNARRAANAALELCKPPAGLDFIRPAQIGISQGRMRTGAYGSEVRRTYGIIGDEANLAARLMQSAPPGQVLVSGPTYKTIASEFAWEELPPLHIKGKTAPVPVARLVGCRPRLTGAIEMLRPYTSMLVGRETELAYLGQIMQHVLASQGQILRLEGPAGIGKSHLAAEFAVEAARQGVQLCVGVCPSSSQDMAYLPWQAIFRSLIGLSDDAPTNEPGQPEAVQPAQQITQLEAVVNKLNPGWQIRLPLLGDLVGLPVPDNATTAAFDPRLRQEALFSLAVEMVHHMAQVQPLLLLIEDAHWMDEASQGLAQAIGRIVAKLPVLLMLVQRPPIHHGSPYLPELDQLPYSHTLNLAELGPESIAGLVAWRIKGQLSPLAASLVQRQVQGNPFFAEELVNVLREDASLVYEGQVWTLSEQLIGALQEANCLARDSNGEWILRPDAQLAGVAVDIPSSVHAAVLARLDRLSEAHKLTIKTASVVGRVFEVQVLNVAHPLQPEPSILQTHLDTLKERDFIWPEQLAPRTAYVFKHNITQQVVYDTLPETQQHRLHRAVGEAIEALQPEAVEHLAYHFSRSGQETLDRALFYLDKAARKAQHDYANETALAYYAQALALQERWEWRKGQIEVLHILGRREDELTALRAMEAMPGAPPYTQAMAWGQYYEATCNYAQAQAAVEQALQIASAEKGDRLDQANSLAYLGLIARRQGDYEHARQWYQQALDLFHAEETCSPENTAAFAQACNGLGVVYRQQGNFDDAKACYEQALALSRQCGNRSGEAEAINGLGVTAFYQRNFSQALDCHQQAMEIRRAIGDWAREGVSLYNLAMVTREMGDYGQAQNCLSAALTIQQVTGNRWEESNVLNELGILYQEMGFLDEAQSCLQKGLNLSREIGDEAGQAYLLSNLGLVMRDRADLANAEQVLHEGLALWEKKNNKYEMSFLYNYLGSVSLQASRLAKAIEHAEKALALHRELDMRLNTTDDLATLAAAYLADGNVATSLNYAEQALTILDECGGQGPEFPQQDYFICCQALAAAGQTERARAVLQSAHDLVMARANKITDPTLRQSFLENVAANRQIVQEAKRVLTTAAMAR